MPTANKFVKMFTYLQGLFSIMLSFGQLVSQAHLTQNVLYIFTTTIIMDAKGDRV